MTFKIRKHFARNGKVDEQDVRQIKRSLNWLGYYTPYEKTGMTDVPDAQVFDALKSFQKDNALPVTGTLKPGDETHQALQKTISQTVKMKGDE